MNYRDALKGEYGPLWRDTFGVGNLKVWNDAQIAHDLFVTGAIHCDNFAVPQVSFDRQVIKYTLEVQGQGLAFDDVAVAVDEGGLIVNRSIAARMAVACNQLMQTKPDAANFILGDLQIGAADKAPPSIVNIYGNTDVSGVLRAGNLQSMGDMKVNGTLYWTTLSPAIPVPVHNHDDRYYNKIDSDLKYAVVNHNHDGAYAAMNHNHDGAYAAVNHNHDAAYATINHNHDAAYAKKTDLNAYPTGVQVTAEFVKDRNRLDALEDPNNGVAKKTDLAAYVKTVDADNNYAAMNHNHNGVYAAANHNHNGVYADVNHKHDIYAPLKHEHDEYAIGEAVDENFADQDKKIDALAGRVTTLEAAPAVDAYSKKDADARFAPVGHKHDDDYAAKNHNHDTAYAAIDHKHTGIYATANHNHDGVYADVNHTHDAAYAAIDHKHTGVYALVNHEHDEYAIGEAVDENFADQDKKIDALAGRVTTLEAKPAVDAYSKKDADARFAPVDHNHDDDYAAKDHKHDIYSLTTHNHDTVYAKISDLDDYVKAEDAAGTYASRQFVRDMFDECATKTDLTEYVKTDDLTSTLARYAELDAVNAELELDRKELELHGRRITDLEDAVAAGGGGTTIDAYTKGEADDRFAPMDHKHDIYSLTTHNHDAAYASKMHSHDGVYAAVGHKHDDDYAAKDHNHTGVYAAANHNHDGDYAALDHKHDIYSLTSHKHDDDYAAKDHNHDDTYAPADHVHAQYAVAEKVDTALGKVDTAVTNHEQRIVTLEGKQVYTKEEANNAFAAKEHEHEEYALGEMVDENFKIYDERIAKLEAGGSSTIPTQVPVLGIGVPAPTNTFCLETATHIKVGGNIVVGNVQNPTYINSSGGIGVGQDASPAYSLISGQPIHVGTYVAPISAGDKPTFSYSYVAGVLHIASTFDDEGKPTALEDQALLKVYGDTEFYGDLVATGYEVLAKKGTFNGDLVVDGGATIGKVTWDMDTGSVQSTETTITGEVTIGEEFPIAGKPTEPYRTRLKVHGDTYLVGNGFSKNATLEIDGYVKINNPYTQGDLDVTLDCDGNVNFTGTRNTIGGMDDANPAHFETYNQTTFHGYNNFMYGEALEDDTVEAWKRYAIDTNSLYCSDYAHIVNHLIVGNRENIEPSDPTSRAQNYILYVGNGKEQGGYPKARISLPTYIGYAYQETPSSLPVCDLFNRCYGTLHMFPCEPGATVAYGGKSIISPRGTLNAKGFIVDTQDPPQNGAFGYTYNPNYQTYSMNANAGDEGDGEAVAIYAPTAENIPSICTNGAAYIGDNIVTNGEYVAVVDPSNTEQKTLIKNDSVETGKVKCSDPLQNDVLNRDVATQMILADIILVCDNGDITLEKFKFTFHRVTEFIVYIKAVDITKTISDADAETARNSTFCGGIAIRAREGYNDFPTNIASDRCDAIPFKILIGEKTTKSIAEYDATLNLQSNSLIIDFVDKSKDLLESVRNPSKTFSSFGIKGLKGFAEAPSNNSFDKFAELF